MANKTEGVRLLVLDVLRTMHEPYSEDVIEDVFLAIENNPAWRRRYDRLSDELTAWVVNNWIGQYTRLLTGGNTIRQVDAKRCKLAKSYTKLQF